MCGHNNIPNCFSFWLTFPKINNSIDITNKNFFLFDKVLVCFISLKRIVFLEKKQILVSQRDAQHSFGGTKFSHVIVSAHLSGIKM